MYFGFDSEGAISLFDGAGTSKIVIGRDTDGYVVLDYGSSSTTPEATPDYSRDLAGQRVLTYTNAEGESMILTEKRLDPFVLCKANGIYDTTNNVAVKENAMIDGGTYFGSTMSVRNITLSIKDIEGHDANREFVDVVFDKSKPGILTVQDGTHTRSIECYVESVTTTAGYLTRITTISLICPDPYFYDTTETNVYISSIIPMFEFLHEFVEYGEEISRISPRRIGTIVNSTADDSIGITMVLRARGEIVNPVITLIETQEHISLGTEDVPFEMNYGDTIIIKTEQGKKNVYDANGDSVNGYLTEDSTFFHLHRGTNSIGYSADVGGDNITIIVMYRYKYVRA